METVIKKVKEEEGQKALAIYEALKGRKGCTWGEKYPTIQHVMEDIKTNSLYGMYHEGKLIGVAAAGFARELDHLTCWNPIAHNPCELARIGVHPDYQHQGLAQRLLTYIEQDCVLNGYDGMHFLVSKTNPPALNLYKSLNYIFCGDTFLYDADWFCCEKSL